VFPPLNQNGNPPSAASVAPGAAPPATAANGTLPSSEPRKIKTFSVRGEQPDGAAVPVGTPPPAKPAPAARTAATPPAAPPRSPPSSANASANAPLSLSPQGGAQPAPAADTRARVAATAPVQPAPAPGAAGSGGGYVVQVSSQRNEADAQASYKALQGKFPAVLGSHAPLIKRADLGDKGVYYRAMVGPFGSPDEATQFCGSLKSAGGQCVVQRN
jgi:SPOR domain